MCFYSLYIQFDVASIGKTTAANIYDSLIPFCVQPAANFVKCKSLHNAHHTKPRIIIVQRLSHFVSSFRFVVSSNTESRLHRAFTLALNHVDLFGGSKV